MLLVLLTLHHNQPGHLGEKGAGVTRERVKREGAMDDGVSEQNGQAADVSVDSYDAYNSTAT